MKTHELGHSIKITDFNKNRMMAYSTELSEWLTDDYLLKMLEKYPLECSFDKYRFVFRTPQDIKDIISTIHNKVAVFEQEKVLLKNEMITWIKFLIFAILFLIGFSITLLVLLIT